MHLVMPVKISHTPYSQTKHRAAGEIVTIYLVNKNFQLREQEREAVAHRSFLATQLKAQEGSC